MYIRISFTMDTIAAVLIMTLLHLLILWYVHVRKYRDISKLAGPGVLQVLRNMLDAKKSAQTTFEALISLNKLYGSVVKLWIHPLKPTLLVSDMKFVEYFLTSNVHLDKSDFYDCLKPYIGLGLASSTGETWKLHRKLLNPAFHTKVLEEYVRVFEKYWTQLSDELRLKVDQESVDLFPILNHYTMHVLCETFLEKKVHSTEEKNYMIARTTFYSIVMERILSLVKRNDFLFRFTKGFKKQWQCAEVLRNFSEKTISDYKTREVGSTNGEVLRQQRLMEILMRQSFSHNEVLDHVSTIVIAGHGTTASTLSFGLFELAKHADIQQKILDETISIVGVERDAEITFQDIQLMKYTECVLKEILRLYTPVPFYDRKTKEDVAIGDVKIPKGIDVSICCYNLHRAAEYFPDPEKFDPDRFMPENIDRIPSYAYVPFSAGPRNCIGKNFAMLEMKSAIAKIVRNFELHSVEHELKLSTEFVLKSDTGMRVKLKPRLKLQDNVRMSYM